MIVGIGVDAVSAETMQEKLSGPHGKDFLDQSFSPEELARACEAPNELSYLAAHYAAKQAVVKAIAPVLKATSFSLRLIEVKDKEGDSPVLRLSPQLRDMAHTAGVDRLHISITEELGLTICFVVAEGAGSQRSLS